MATTENAADINGETKKDESGTEDEKQWYEKDVDDEAFGEEMKKFSASFLFEEGDEAAQSDDVRRIAEALAPQLSEFEDLLHSSTNAIGGDLSPVKQQNPQSSSGVATDMMNTSVEYDSGAHDDHVTYYNSDQEDDDLDNELQGLAMSEQLLREELEFAQEFSSTLMGQAQPPPAIDPTSGNEEPPTSTTQSTPPVEENIPPLDYTLQDHAKYLRLETEKVGGWYFCDMTQFLVNHYNEGLKQNHHGLIRDYCLPLPFRRLKRLYGGLVHYNVHPAPPASSSPANIPIDQIQQQTSPAQQSDQSGGKIQPSSGQNDGKTDKNMADDGNATGGGGGSGGGEKKNTSSNDDRQNKQEAVAPPQTPTKPPQESLEEPLPVRTVSIWIRPDVLCGAVMDAVHNAFESTSSDSKYTTLVLKRQGGHLRGAVLARQKKKNKDDAVSYKVAYVADAQLCTMKNETLERRLLIRFYHIQDDPEAFDELSGMAMMKEQQEQKELEETGINPSDTADYDDAFDLDYSNNDNENRAVLTSRHLKQACSLIQRIVMAHDQTDPSNHWLGPLNETVFFSQQEMQHAVGRYLETNYKSCLSVREENKKRGKGRRRLTLPALSSEDWTLLQESWSFCRLIFEELDTRDCSYNTLATLGFGQFPALPTLDLQYCSQLRRLSRETMITQLLKAAKELEDYAKSTEYECASFLTILEPMIKFYGIIPLRLPTPKKLEDYPLEYIPPQVTCPPWGNKVVEALNQVAAETTAAVRQALPSETLGGGDDDGILSSNQSSVVNATKAVQRVFCAFMKQDDEEQAARLGRKNAQVMDRLANVVSHQRAVLHSIRDAHKHSRIAEQAADEFLNKAKQATNIGEDGYPRILQHQVPVLNIRIRVGGSLSGTCFITPNHMLLTTSTYIPFVGRGVARATLFELSSVEFQADDSAPKTLLNPFPNTMSVLVNREVVYSFRPSLGASRLCKFLTIVKSLLSGEAGEFSQPDKIVEHKNDSGDGNKTEDDGSHPPTDIPSEDEPIPS